MTTIYSRYRTKQYRGYFRCRKCDVVHDRGPLHGFKGHGVIYRCLKCGESRPVAWDGFQWVG